ncbi:MAG: hypothetical protein C0606_06565 [Hyphomicrobiales bacterium]|nr:MAG: hypothetical protein C0606_06565 [Hyphomicrobiales bacterium]
MRRAGNRERIFAVVAAMAALALTSGAFAGSLRDNPLRHDTFAASGLPTPYSAMANPYSAGPQALAEGAQLYIDYCATCHGPSGRGDGEGSTDPRPPSLRRSDRAADGSDDVYFSDGFLMWAISEGGEPIGSPMPPYKLALSETERWNLVAFIAADFPRSR